MSAIMGLPVSSQAILPFETWKPRATSLGGPFPFGQGHSDGTSKLAPSRDFSLAAIEQLFILHQLGCILAPLKRSPSKWREILMCFFLKLPTF